MFLSITTQGYVRPRLILEKFPRRDESRNKSRILLEESEVSATKLKFPFSWIIKLTVSLFYTYTIKNSLTISFSWIHNQSKSRITPRCTPLVIWLWMYLIYTYTFIFLFFICFSKRQPVWWNKIINGYHWWNPKTFGIFGSIKIIKVIDLLVVNLWINFTTWKECRKISLYKQSLQTRSYMECYLITRRYFCVWFFKIIQ